MPQLDVLANIRIASPCTVPWSGMSGDNRTRHCGECNLNVFNLSDMTRIEAEQLILAHDGRLCVTYFQRSDGTVLTRDCPIGLAAARRRIARFFGSAAAAIVMLASGVYALARGGGDTAYLRLRWQQPFNRIVSWLEGPPLYRMAGEVSMPPLTPAQIDEILKQADESPRESRDYGPVEEV
jgi:hypothetical protein